MTSDFPVYTAPVLSKGTSHLNIRWKIVPCKHTTTCIF